MTLTQDERIIATNADWLPPEGTWPAIDDLRTEHHRLLAGMHAAYADARAIAVKYEEEDAAVDSARRAGIRSDSPATMPKTTPPRRREAEQDEANKTALAARDALFEWAEEAFARIHELAPELHAQLDANEREAQADEEHARRALDIALAKQRGLVPLRGWLRHELSELPGYRVPFNTLGTPAADEPLDLRDLTGGITVA